MVECSTRRIRKKSKETRTEERKKEMNIPSSKLLWRITYYLGQPYYEIKLDGEVIDRFKIEEPAVSFLKSKGML